MNLIAILATQVSDDERIWGPAVWFSMMLFGILAFIVSPVVPLTDHGKIWIQRALPALALLWSASLLFTDLREWFIGESYFHKRHYYQLDIAVFITIAFGAGFSMDAIRSRNLPSKIVGWCSMTVFALAIGVIVWFLSGELFGA